MLLDPQFKMECDNCASESFIISSVWLARVGFEVNVEELNKKIKEYGWKIFKGDYYCMNCDIPNEDEINIDKDK